MNESKPRAYSLKAFATEMGLSLSTVKNRVRDGTIRFARVGGRVLIPAAELDRLLGGEDVAIEEGERPLAGRCETCGRNYPINPAGRPRIELDLTKVYEMLDSGSSVKEVAEHFNVSQGLIYRERSNRRDTKGSPFPHLNADDASLLEFLRIDLSEL